MVLHWAISIVSCFQANGMQFHVDQMAEVANSKKEIAELNEVPAAVTVTQGASLRASTVTGCQRSLKLS